MVYEVRVEAKQQFLSEIPYVGAILPLVSARIPHTSDSPLKAEPLIRVNEYCEPLIRVNEYCCV